MTYMAHKIELRPTREQEEFLNKSFGIKRHCWNQLLDYFSKSENKWSKKAAQRYYIDTIRLNFPWYEEVALRTAENVIIDLDNAFKHFFRRVKKGEKPGFPKFKKYGINESFLIREPTKNFINGRYIKIPKLKSPIKMREKLRYGGIIKRATISKIANRYFASILVDTNEYNPKDVERQESVGVDFGITNLATLSTGEKFPQNQKLKDNLKKLAKLQRKLSRQKIGSNRREITKLKIQKLNYRVSNQRKNILHDVSDYLTSNFDSIAIEDLNVSGMLKNRHLSRAISDCGFGYLKTFIKYKGELRNCDITIADRFFPSSKLCSNCGNKKEDLTLKDRIYNCNNCGISLDRDSNAAINLNNLNKCGQITAHYNVHNRSVRPELVSA